MAEFKISDLLDPSKRIQRALDFGVPEDRVGDSVILNLLDYAEAMRKGEYLFIDQDSYEVLGCQIPETDAGVQSAYRKLAIQLYPETNNLPPEFFHVVTRAYENLEDEDNRRIFQYLVIDNSILREGDNFQDFQKEIIKNYSNGDSYPWEAVAPKKARERFDPFSDLKAGIIPEASLVDLESLNDFKEAAVFHITSYCKSSPKRMNFLKELYNTIPELYFEVTSDPSVQEFVASEQAQLLVHGDVISAFEIACAYGQPQIEVLRYRNQCKEEVLKSLRSSEPALGIGMISEFQSAYAICGDLIEKAECKPLISDKEVLDAAIKLGLQMKNKPNQRLFHDLLETMSFNSGSNSGYWTAAVMKEAKGIISDISLSFEDKVSRVSDLVEASYPLYESRGNSKLEDFVQLNSFKRMFRKVALNLRSKNQADKAREFANKFGIDQKSYKDLLQRSTGETIRWFIGGAIRGVGQGLDIFAEFCWKTRRTDSKNPNSPNPPPRPPFNNIEMARAVGAWIPRIPARILIFTGNLFWHQGLNSYERDK